jgi:hypothetical protein
MHKTADAITAGTEHLASRAHSPAALYSNSNAACARFNTYLAVTIDLF